MSGDILGNKDYEEALRNSGFTATQIIVIRDVARHASETALNSLITVCETADAEIMSTLLLSALMLLRQRTDTYAKQIAGMCAAQMTGARNL